VKFPVFKYGLWFRTVEETDAAFILSLRTHKELAKHLSPTDNDLPKQRAWIHDYKAREAQEMEFYLIFGTEITYPCGLIRLYDISADTFTIGSWLTRPGSDEFIAPASDLFSMVLGFETLKKKKCLFDTRKANKKVVRYHRLFANQVGEDGDNYYFEIDIARYEYKKDFLGKVLGII